MMNIPPPMPPAAFNEEEEIEPNSVRTTISEEEVDMEPTETKLRRATEQKEKGNAAFANKDLVCAKNAYLEGLKIIDKVENAVDLKTAMQGNVALMSLKLKEYDDCIRYSSKVLKTSPDNTKAKYRRVQGYLNTSHYDDAKEDLKDLINKEPNNKEYRSLYDKAVAGAKALNEERKEQFSGMFKKSLYGDRELEMQKRIKDEKVKEEKLRKEWEDDMAKRALDDGQEQQDFESWKAVKQGMPNNLKKDEEKVDLDVSKDNIEKVKGTSPPRKKQIITESEEEYTEAEKKILEDMKGKGYCYFRDSKLTEEEKAQKSKINMNAPKAVRDPESEQPIDSGKAISSWNSQGTSYEEKSMTKWAKEVIEGLLKGSTEALDDGSQLKIKSVECQGGEAQISVIKGTKRYIYDLEYSIKASITPAKTGSKPTEITITMNPNNVSTMSHEWLNDVSVSSNVNNCGIDKSKVMDVILQVLRGSFDKFDEVFVGLV